MSTVGLVSFSLAKRAPEHKSADEARACAHRGWSTGPSTSPSRFPARPRSGAEVVWTRLLGLMLGATVYTFSIILAVFLVGHRDRQHGAARMLVRDARNPQGAARAGARCCWPARSPGPPYMLSHSLPYWPINPLLSTSPWFTFQIDLVRCFWAMLPATLLWGASFPLALAAAASVRRRPGPPGGRHLCRQYRRRDSGRARLQHDPDPVDRDRAASQAVLIAHPGR